MSTNPYFDEERWTTALRQPGWYLELGSEYRRLLAQAEQHPEEKSAIKDAVYSFLEERLAENAVALAATGPNWDEERQPVDTAVIHHTSNPPGMTWQRISAMHLVRLYVPPYEPAEYRGQPVYSGHFRDERPVFYAYHWLIREDGYRERLLEDAETGWHAGMWHVNCRSVAFCLDGDFDEAAPSDDQLASVAKLPPERYPTIAPQRVLGHCEVRTDRTCPGNSFRTEWKPKLLQLLDHRP